ncbi:hypothetical protein PanWU01x14_093100, partial [Parasponia andersonii]
SLLAANDVKAPKRQPNYNYINLQGQAPGYTSKDHEYNTHGQRGKRAFVSLIKLYLGDGKLIFLSFSLSLSLKLYTYISPLSLSFSLSLSLSLSVRKKDHQDTGGAYIYN